MTMTVAEHLAAWEQFDEVEKKIMDEIGKIAPHCMDVLGDANFLTRLQELFTSMAFCPTPYGMQKIYQARQILNEMDIKSFWTNQGVKKGEALLCLIREIDAFILNRGDIYTEFCNSERKILSQYKDKCKKIDFTHFKKLQSVLQQRYINENCIKGLDDKELFDLVRPVEITQSPSNTVIRVASPLGKKIYHLDLPGLLASESIKELSEKRLKKIIWSCPNLVFLSLSGVGHMKNVFIDAIHVGCKKLSTIDLTGCSFEDADITHYIKTKWSNAQFKVIL